MTYELDTGLRRYDRWVGQWRFGPSVFTTKGTKGREVRLELAIVTFVVILSFLARAGMTGGGASDVL